MLCEISSPTLRLSSQTQPTRTPLPICRSVAASWVSGKHGMTELAQLLLFYLLVYFFVNGLDDLILDLRLLHHAWRRRLGGVQGSLPSIEQLDAIPEQRIAILVPLWKEAGVIERMVETNLQRLRYTNFRIVLGVYPNDSATRAVATRLAARHARVDLVECSRPGPTSKADCLNHLFDGVQRLQRERGLAHPLIMLHDAEDMLHTLSLHLVNWYSANYEMVQVPVLPVATDATDWLHGLYCDEFAEFLTRDLPVRAAERAFLPSNGVGTMFRREVLEDLRIRQGGVLFEDECLTEDYEIGLKLHLTGCRQLFLPLTRCYGELLATREYFPRTLRAAIRQRTRWITGQCLQSWERNGWPSSWSLLYWFWRDRRGLLSNYLNVLAVVFLCISVTAWLAPETTGLGPWLWLASSVPGSSWLYTACTLLSVERLTLRMAIVWRTYGGKLAVGVLPRMLLSCVVNLAATTAALGAYVVARRSRKRQRWLKTDHHFPDAVAAFASIPAETYDGLPQPVGGKAARATSLRDYHKDSRFPEGN